MGTPDNHQEDTNEGKDEKMDEMTKCFISMNDNLGILRKMKEKVVKKHL